jgi:hypothetical protein
MLARGSGLMACRIVGVWLDRLVVVGDRMERVMLPQQAQQGLAQRQPVRGGVRDGLHARTGVGWISR